jgi:hypothetical protein
MLFRVFNLHSLDFEETRAYFGIILGYIQKFPDWLPGARTANGTALRH